MELEDMPREEPVPEEYPEYPDEEEEAVPVRSPISEVSLGGSV